MINSLISATIHWTGKVKSIAFTVFGWEVAWYGIIITTGMLIGLLIAIYRAKKFNITSDEVLEAFLSIIPIGIVFARIGYVMVRPEYFPSDFGWDNFVDIIAIWDGGLTITTGIIGGIIGGLIWCKFRKVDLVFLLDALAPVVLVCQAIGRWGNFFNQELYGAAVTNESWQFFPYSVFIADKGGFYQATFFYESLLNILFFVAIIIVLKRLRLKGGGALLYLFSYPFIRFLMEFIRDDGDVYAVFNYTQLIVGLVALASATTLAILIVKKVKSGDKIFYKNGVPKELWFDAKHSQKKGDSVAMATENSESNVPQTQTLKKKPQRYNKSKKGKK